MPNRFDFNPQTQDIGFPIYPKGTYEFEIGEPKTYNRTAKNAGDPDRYGVSVLLKCSEGEMKGKVYNVNFDFSSDYGPANAMTFLVVASGHDANDEGVAAFRAETQGKDFTVDVEQKLLGDGWTECMKGQKVLGDMDTEADPNNVGKLRQKFPKWLPVQR